MWRLEEGRGRNLGWRPRRLLRLPCWEVEMSLWECVVGLFGVFYSEVCSSITVCVIYCLLLFIELMLFKV